MSIFDKTISVWEEASKSASKRHEMTVADFLKLGSIFVQTITPLRAWYDYGLATYPTNPQESARAFAFYKREKLKLPLGTIGGNYAGTGGSTDLLQATNLMCLDIDSEKPEKAALLVAQGKPVPNSHVTDWQRVKRQLSHLPWVAYCGLSVGGHGLFVIVPIDSHYHYEERWKAAEYLLFKHYGLTIDPRTSDAGRGRFVSIDEQAYVNENAETFTFTVPSPPQQKTPRKQRTFVSTSDAETVAQFVEYIEARRIDITAQYGGSKGIRGKGWADIPPGFYQVFGEAGEDFFHRVSAFHPEYSVRETTKKWHQNKNRSQLTIATFFLLCSQWGITHAVVREYFSHTATPTATPKPAPTTAEATPSAAPPPKATTAAIIYKRTPLIPEQPLSILDSMTEAEFNAILSPEAVSRWQMEHPEPPF